MDESIGSECQWRWGMGSLWGGAYHGALWRGGAERLLREAAEGSFLVRSGLRGEELILSVKGPPDFFSAAAEVAHVGLGVDSRGYLTADGDFFFQSLADLLAHHIAFHRSLYLSERLYIQQPVELALWELRSGEMVPVGPVAETSFPAPTHRVRGRDVHCRWAERAAAVWETPGPQPANERLLLELVKEADALLRLSRPHANLAGLIGVSLLGGDGRVGVALEASSLGSLRALLGRETELRAETRTRLGREAVAGLGFVWSEGLVHRRLSSESFGLFPGPSLKLAGLGGWAALGAGKATPALLCPDEPRQQWHRWAAPELLASGVWTDAAQSWSLGLVLWELLADPPPRLPYPAGPADQPPTAREVAGWLAESPPALPASALPAGLALLLSPKPDLRPSPIDALHLTNSPNLKPAVTSSTFSPPLPSGF